MVGDSGNRKGRPNRPPSKPIRHIWGSAPRDVYYRTNPDRIEHFSLMIDPIPYLTPGAEKVIRKMPDLVQDMLERNLCMIQRIESKSGKSQLSVRLTPHGKARWALNRRLLNFRPVRLLPKEQRELLAQYLLVDLILSRDFDPAIWDYDPQKPISKRDVFHQLQELADREAVEREAKEYGPPSKWSEMIRRYFHYKYYRAILAEEAKQFLQPKIWSRWMKLREKGGLSVLVPANVSWHG